MKAGAAAEEAVKGSTLISIESEDKGAAWEAQVVTPEGVEHEMDLSATDASVTRGPTTDEEDASDRAKHQRRLKDASVDYREAVDALDGTVQNGVITELNLDTWDGKTVWEADVNDPSGTKHEVKVDAGNAKILSDRADG